MYSAGIITSIYYLYDLEVTKKSVIDLLLMVLFVYVIYDWQIYSHYSELLAFGVILVILIFHYNISYRQALLYSFVILFKLVFHYPVESIIDLFRDELLGEMFITLSVPIYYFIYTMSVVSVVFMYFLGSYLLKRVIDINRTRLKHVYLASSILMIVLILVLSFLMNYVSNVYIYEFPIEESTRVIFASTITFVLIPFLVLQLLKQIYIEDLKTELLEEELEQIQSVRVLMYRYSHNLKSLLLTVDLLLKENNKKKLITYLDEMIKKKSS